MSSYDNYDDGGRSDYSSARYYDDRRYQRDPRYAESRDSYAKTHTASRDLVPRTRDESEYGVEEIRRDFPPPTYSKDEYYDDDRYSRSGRDRGLDRRDYKKASRGTAYSEEEKKRRRVLSNQDKIMAAVIGGALAVGGKELFDRREAKQDGHNVQRNALSSAALGAAGAFAAYQGADLYNKHSGKEKEDKKALVAQKGRGAASYYSDDESDDDARNKKGHKNFLESALAAAGLGGAVSALRGGSDHDDKRSDTRSRRGDSTSRSRSGSRSASKGATTANKVQKAAMASLIAGATEAFRVAKEPGGWQGEKAKRVFTAAAGAATIDAAHDEKHSKLGIAESVIGGLLGNRIMNGSRRNIEEDKHTGRSRSRSRARSDGGGGGGGSSGVSGLAALATAGLGALGAKKIADGRERSRSRRRQSADSYGSRTRSRDRSHRSRSRSVVDTARRGLAKLGLGNEPEGSDRERDASTGYKSSSSRRHHRGGSADSRDDYYSSDRRRGGGDRDRSRDRSRDHSRTRDRNDYDDKGRSSGRRDRRKGGTDYSSDSDLGSSSEDEKKAKKMKGKQVITTGLAAVATIHAAHNVYQSMEKRRSRQKAVREGKLSTEAAKKLKQKALLQDAASVGFAALGIKGALSEMKEAREVSHEIKEWQEEKARRHERRLERQLRARSTGASREPRGRRDDDERQLGNRDSYAALPAPPPGSEVRGYSRDRWD
ncbi:hypothetical protein F503_06970 [Ophiostoma piceae UAMH 11346]|uniref:Uncharacterized protein n=1 Tax=Ophiostoma piceae (strain UAMH 11346) TaxID=1262450 RepID=S3C6S4_OPHP1|nr:hypothetical protein F503_06970 [Ophiostoma piceae UAMH 11346]